MEESMLYALFTPNGKGVAELLAHLFSSVSLSGGLIVACVKRKVNPNSRFLTTPVILCSFLFATMIVS